MEVRKIKPSDTWMIRQRVMWPEKPLSYVQLPEDEKGIHFGLFYQSELVSIVSLFIEQDTAQFRKFATQIDSQGKGFGTLLLRAVIQTCFLKNVQNLWCNARISAYPFYQKFGFEIVSEPWEKDGVEYVKMNKKIMYRV